MEPILGKASSPAIAQALELVTASIANPTELNAIGTAVPDWRLVRTNVVGSDEATLYRLDADTDGVSAPYIMASATAGLRWVAIAGRYQNDSMSIASLTAATSPTAAAFTVAGGAGIGENLQIGATTGAHFAFIYGGDSGTNGGARFQVWNNASTKLAMGNKSAILGGAYDGTPYIYAPSRLEFPSSILFSDTTAASSSITGAVIIGNGTAATTVGIGGGVIWVGTTVNMVGTTGAGYKIGAASGYGVMAFNADFTLNGTLGIFAGATGDSALYLNCPTSNIVYVRCNNATMASFATAGSKIVATTSASTSLTGSLVIGDQSTAGTNVGIGGGNINAGGTLTVGGASSLVQVGSSGSIAGDYIYKISNSNATGLGLRIQPGADGNDAIAVRNAAGTLITCTISGGGLLTTGSTTLHATNVALTNGAAAAAGTLLNAPVAGNPTKWVPINDNGTTRYLPAW